MFYSRISNTTDTLETREIGLLSGVKGQNVLDSLDPEVGTSGLYSENSISVALLHNSQLVNHEADTEIDFVLLQILLELMTGMPSFDPRRSPKDLVHSALHNYREGLQLQHHNTELVENLQTKDTK